MIEVSLNWLFDSYNNAIERSFYNEFKLWQSEFKNIIQRSFYFRTF